MQDFELTTKCACFDGCNDDTPTIKPSDKPSGPSKGSNSKAGVAVGEIGIALMAL